MEGLFLLRRVGDRYRIAGKWYGAFRIAAEKVTPLTGKQGFALESRDAQAAEVAADIVARLRRHPQ